MSALDKLDEKIKNDFKNVSNLEMAVSNSQSVFATTAELAAKELAAKDAELSALRERVEALEHLEAVAQDVNEWLKTSAGLKGSAHQRELEAALQAP